MNKFLVKYAYTNQVSDEVGVWVMIPRGVDFIHDDSTFIRTTKIQTGETLSYFNLLKGQRISFEYFTDYYRPQRKSLSKEEEQYYLRSTTLSPINEEIRALATQITHSHTTAKEMAKAIFLYIVTNYKYIYPPAERGVLSFLSSKKGDCGEFSFLFTSLCRAVGIPTRSIIGSWAYGKMNGHVWNEYYDPACGWTAVDTSMAYIQKNQKFRFIDSNIRTLHWMVYFGETEGQRIIFSLDSEPELTPALAEKDSAFILMDPFKINGELFLWGIQSLDGNAPYLQPIYVQIKGEVDKTPSIHDLFGTWIVQQQGVLGKLGHYRKTLFLTGLLLMICSFIFSNPPLLDLLYKLIFVVTSISFILRKERTLLFSLITVLLFLSVFSTMKDF